MSNGKSLSVCYSMAKKRKRASGGMVKSGDPEMNMAKGGEVEPKPMAEACPHCGHQPMSEGGVAEREGDERIADFKEDKFDVLPHYSAEMSHADESGSNSGDELGDSEEGKRRREAKDLVSRVMRKRKK